MTATAASDEKGNIETPVKGSVVGVQLWLHHFIPDLEENRN